MCDSHSPFEKIVNEARFAICLHPPSPLLIHKHCSPPSPPPSPKSLPQTCPPPPINIPRPSKATAPLHPLRPATTTLPRPLNKEAMASQEAMLNKAMVSHSTASHSTANKTTINQRNPQPSTVVVQQQPQQQNNDACCWGCLAACCICCALEELC
ncbi:hypothetical protein BC937DRAFT_86777 [Endogone sp. FLAS-F59071]|nr:hypothetical protein BC937DRAFT_86777 [Endogone sp. FLAS-F59071]|eukprot:RUS19872.1 hypothetical protein BC937DRAFT_86777 [Endogone sp. FLAS-F59071]